LFSSCIHAYHHFDDPLQMTRALAQRLKPKGRLFVIDFLAGESMEVLAHFRQESGHSHTVAHTHG
jgi:2-polyprenyl-3-methyl-5-hydroxy-6-metoxy-1,4-benzoquinol methylase